ncbi:MAG TPA: RNA polymerase sigma factor [Clostridiaceae bacterium]|nr:RNA polymerase sigma factor [Clostridiaceae bacterium]
MKLEDATFIDKQSDIELYQKFLNGNNEAFNELIIKYRKQLVFFVMKYVRNMEVAEDIVQDSFVYMIINKINYDFKYSFRTYIYTIAKSRTINYLKKNSKVIFISDVVEENYYNENIDIEEEYIRQEKKETLQKAIKKLKIEYQVIIYLYEFQGFKYKEISEILNQSMSKTKMMIHRAKKSLEKIIKEEDGLC